MQRGSLDEVVTRLEANPVFRLGLASKELFHSNFIAWCMEYDQELALGFLKLFGVNEINAEKLEVRTEESHFDLSVYLGEARLAVIENKLFNPVDSAQLRRYGVVLDKATGEDRRATRVHLSLLGPFVTASAPKWSGIRYDDIKPLFDEYVDAQSTKSFENEMIQRYSQVLSDLIEIRDLFAVSGDEGTIEDWSRYQFQFGPRYTKWSARFKRIRFANLAETLRKSTAAIGCDYSFGFSNGHPLVEAFIAVPGKKGMVGWQYQAGALKIAVRLTSDELKSLKTTTRTAREDYVANEFGWWVGDSSRTAAAAFTEFHRSAFDSNEKNSHNNKFFGYEPGFVYRRLDIGSPSVPNLVKFHQQVMTVASARGSSRA